MYSYSTSWWALKSSLFVFLMKPNNLKISVSWFKAPLLQFPSSGWWYSHWGAKIIKYVPLQLNRTNVHRLHTSIYSSSKQADCIVKDAIWFTYRWGYDTHAHTAPWWRGAAQQALVLFYSTGCSCCGSKYTDKATVGSSIPMYNGMNTFAVCHWVTALRAWIGGKLFRDKNCTINWVCVCVCVYIYTTA